MQIPTPEERVENMDLKYWLQITEQWTWEDRIAKAGPEEKEKLLTMDMQRKTDLGLSEKHRKLPPLHLEVHENNLELHEDRKAKRKAKRKAREVISEGSSVEELEVEMHLSGVENPRLKRKRGDDDTDEEDNVEDSPRTKKRKLGK